MQEKLFFSSTTLITNVYVIKHDALWFHVAQLFLNRISAPSSLDLQIGIVSTVRNRLSENRYEIKEIWDLSRKSKLISRHEDGKNMSPHKNYKLKPILTTLHTKFWIIICLSLSRLKLDNYRYYMITCHRCAIISNYFP